MLDNVRSSLDEINHDLRNVEERREKLIKGTRDVIALCSKSIIALHRSEIDQAQINMHQAKTMLEEFRQYSKTDLYKYISTAEQELVEAYGLKCVLQDSPIPSMKELNVSGSSYITGLLDCIGEVKRMVYDKMRVGRAQDAREIILANARYLWCCISLRCLRPSRVRDEKKIGCCKDANRGCSSSGY